MTCSASINCSDVYSSNTIEVLPDIVGLGILISFLSMSVFTLGLVFFGYFFDSLPGHLMKWADWGFLQTYHLCKSCRIRFGAIEDSKTVSKTPACKHSDANIDRQRRKSLTAFILSMSDQQLVTGPAMIIAALARHCDISCYEFQIVTGLALLASTTHMTTLAVLRDYLRHHKVVRNIRAAGMVVNLALLLYCLWLSAAAEAVDNSTNIHCAELDFSGYLYDSGQFFTTLVTTIFLVSSYAQSLLPLFNDGPDPMKTFTRWRVSKIAGVILEDEDFERWYIQEVLQSEHRPGSQTERESLWGHSTTNASLVKRAFYTHMAVYNDYRRSFLSELPSLLWSSSYGITSVVVSRMSAPDISNSENAIDFGQIVPLFLLFLPVLAGVEMFYEAHPVQAQIHGSLKNIAPKFRKKTARRVPSDGDVSGNNPESRGSVPEVELQTLPSTDEHLSGYASRPAPDDIGSRDSSPSVEFASQIVHPNALEFMEFHPYSRKDARVYLSVMFWVAAAIGISTGILLWIIPLYGILWTVFAFLDAFIQVTPYFRFFIITMKKVHVLKKTLRDANTAHIVTMFKPPRGTRAPPSSLYDSGALVEDTQSVDRSHSIKDDQLIISQASNLRSHEMVGEPMFDEYTNQVIDALQAPRRRETFEAQGDDLGVLERRFRRVDTESGNRRAEP